MNRALPELSPVTIRYHRPPDGERCFHQLLLAKGEDCLVTLLEAAPLGQAVSVGGRAVLEPGAPVVWFTFPGAWHDVGRFHLRDGTFTGWYANVLTPVEIAGAEWTTTDLFLDVWKGTDGSVELLDEDEFREAAERGWISDSTARRARAEADALLRAARSASWPPAPVPEWDLARARRALHQPRMAP